MNLENIEKGQMPLLSHTITVGFSMILILLVVMTLNSVKGDYQSFIASNEMKEVCTILKNGIEKIYRPTDHRLNATMGRIFIDLPERIADMRYRVRFLNSSLLIETNINHTCVVGFNVTYSGSIDGGRTVIEWIQSDIDRIEMRKV